MSEKNWMKGAVKRPGAFRAKAKERGLSTDAFSRQVLANKDRYSPLAVKQASLARTFNRARKG